MAKGVLRHRDFRLLWGGETVSELGSQVSLLAIPLLAVRTLHATAFEMGLLTAASTAAFLVVGLPAGVWVDRMRRRRVMIGADLGRMLALGSVPVAYAAGVLTLAQLFVAGSGCWRRRYGPCATSPGPRGEAAVGEVTSGPT